MAYCTGAHIVTECVTCSRYRRFGRLSTTFAFRPGRKTEVGLISPVSTTTTDRS